MTACISDRCIEEEKKNARNREIWFDAVDLNEAKMLAGLRMRKKIEDEIHLCLGSNCDCKKDEDPLAALRRKRMEQLRAQEAKGKYREVEYNEFVKLQEKGSIIVAFFPDSMRIFDQSIVDAIEEYLIAATPERTQFSFLSVTNAPRDYRHILVYDGKRNIDCWKLQSHFREPEYMAECLDEFLDDLEAKVRTIDDDRGSDEEESDANPFCGYPGCPKNYAHEHVEWNKTSSMANSDSYRTKSVKQSAPKVYDDEEVSEDDSFFD